MFSTRATSWVPITGLLALVAGGLGWFLLGFSAWPATVRPLAEVPGVRMEIFEEDGNLLTWKDIAALPPDRWRPAKEGRQILSMRRQRALWVRFTVRNATDQPLDGVLAHFDYFVDRVEAWTRSGVVGETGDPGSWRHGLSGETIPVRARRLWGRDIALPVSVPAHGETAVVVRAEDFFGTFLGLMWWPGSAEFTATQTRGLLAEGVYFGGLLALLGYNVMLWLRLRLAELGYYSLYLGSAAGFMALARAWPSLLGWTLASPALEGMIAVAMVVSGLWLTQFTRVFLELKLRQPRVDRLARLLAAGLLVIAAGALSGIWVRTLDWMMFAVASVAAAHTALLAVALWAWRRGARQARFFIAAFGCLFAATLPVMALWLGKQVMGTQPILFVMIGSGLEMLLLSFATADRFAQAQREKASTQQKLVEETEQRRAIQEAYADELAVEVRERTHELEAANTDKDRMIAVIGHDLRSPLTSLTQTAEQLARTPDDTPALGQFARDTSQVGRQALLLIEDLVLWARLRAGLRQPPGRHLARALVAPVVALHRTFAGRRGIALEVAVPESLRLSTDLVLAQTLLRNLVANALKAARTCVTVSAVRQADAVRITVRDDGPGLPAAVLAAFSQENPGPAATESGLGLRLCHEISSTLRTQLEVRSIPGQGAEFEFILPADTSDSASPV